MSDIKKKPYEISLWEDVLAFKVYYYDKKDGTKKGEADLNSLDDLKEISGTIPEVIQYYKEQKICVIGSNTMDTPIRAVKPKFTSKINGENTLTFTVYFQYWDESTSKLEWNPYMMYLTNERKVKLKYDDKWYDFIIKNISEDSASKAFTYTCKDLFINELSKTGFELEFDNELGNNMGTLPKLAEKILEGSDWKLDTERTDSVLQFIEEPLYRLEVSKELKAKNSKTKGGKDIKKGQKIYIFYSTINEKKTRFEFLYDIDQKYPYDDKNVLLKPEEQNYYIENVSWEGVTDNTPYGKAEFISDRRGNRLVKSQKTWFDPVLKRTVNLYKNGEICGYEDLDYVSAAAVQSYVANPSNFSSTTGWYVGKGSGSSPDDESPKLSLHTYPELTDENIDNYTGQSYLKFEAEGAKQILINSGIQNNRTSIGSFRKGERYCLDLEIFFDSSGTSLPVWGSDGNFVIQIFDYTIENGQYVRPETVKENLFSVNLKNKSTLDDDKKFKFELKCNYSISENNLKNTRIGIFIKTQSKGTFYIKSMEFYPYKTYINNDNQEVQCFPNVLIDPQITKKQVYYNKHNGDITAEDIEMLPLDSTYPPYYGDPNSQDSPFEKVRSITAKESNRFNLLQSLCELFECWACFRIEHKDNGEIKYSLDENGYFPEKHVFYKQYIGQDNPIGFKYGINLKSIKRTLDSNGTISKIIVKNNANEFAPGGFCSIARAQENPSGENTIYNFDYYVGQGLIGFSALSNDLYGQQVSGYMSYYPRLKVLNNQAQEKTEVLSKLINDIAKYDSQYQTYKISVDEASQDKNEQTLAFKELTSVEIAQALPEYQKYDKSKHKSSTLWHYYKKKDGEYTKLDEKPSSEGSQYYARLKWWDNNEATKIKNAIARDSSIIKNHSTLRDTQEDLKMNSERQKVALEKELKDIRESKIVINQEFYKKYSRFIQEGSWISEDYIDDNLYYIDALSTLYTSSRPQVKYTIDVVELSALEEYKDFNFALGDKTFVEDVEFFGWSYDGTNRLYREEVIVSEIAIELDSPESNKITVQNYKTQFEDLFQRVVATTQQIQFSTGEYKRGAAIVQPDGTINPTSLQNSFINNAFTLSNARDQSVIIGDDGITTINLSRPSEMLRIISGGLYISKDGGITWTTGISASGINANCITTGQLNVNEVNLTMGSEVAFRWDEKGISSYKRDEYGIDAGTYTRFDQFGIYGIKNNSNFDALTDAKGDRNEALELLKSSASFGLTWNGFWLKSDHDDGYVSISSDKDFEVVRFKDEDKKEKVSIIQIGRLDDNDNGYYGIRINDLSGNPVMESDQDGKLWLRKQLNVSTSDSKEVIIGLNGDNFVDSNGEDHGRKIISANDKFKVYEDGYLIGNGVSFTNGYFEGNGIFKGTIEASGGQIGNLTVEQVTDSLTYSVHITSDKGIAIKDDGSVTETTLQAELWYNDTKLTVNNGKVTINDKDYKVEYKWYKNDTILSNKEGKLTVPLEDINPSATYSCTITLIENLDSSGGN